MRASPKILMLAAGSLLLLSACRQDMHDQPRFKPLAKSDFYADMRSERPPVEDTVARGQLHDDTYFYTGKIGANPGDFMPFQVTQKDLQRGRQRFNIYCAPCHSRVGDGNGMIVQRGFKQPASYHIERLQKAPLGYFFDVMTNGFGAMASHAYEVAVRDRWAIAAYIRVLQDAQPPAPETTQPTTAAKPGEAGQSPTAEGGQGTPAKAPTEQKPKTGEQHQ